MHGQAQVSPVISFMCKKSEQNITCRGLHILKSYFKEDQQEPFKIVLKQFRNYYYSITGWSLETQLTPTDFVSYHPVLIPEKNIWTYIAGYIIKKIQRKVSSM